MCRLMDREKELTSTAAGVMSGQVMGIEQLVEGNNKNALINALIRMSGINYCLLGTATC